MVIYLLSYFATADSMKELYIYNAFFFFSDFTKLPSNILNWMQCYLVCKIFFGS